MFAWMASSTDLSSEQPKVMAPSKKTPLPRKLPSPPVPTWTLPVTDAVKHPRLIPSMFLSPETARQEDVTLQVPTTSPPHALTLGTLPQVSVEVEPPCPPVDAPPPG